MDKWQILLNHEQYYVTGWKELGEPIKRTSSLNNLHLNGKVKKKVPGDCSLHLASCTGALPNLNQIGLEPEPSCQLVFVFVFYLYSFCIWTEQTSKPESNWFRTLSSSQLLIVFVICVCIFLFVFLLHLHRSWLS